MDWSERIEAWAPAVMTVFVLVASAALVRVSADAADLDPAFAVDPAAVAVLEHPAWMSPELAGELASQISARTEPLSLLAPEGLSTWIARLAHSSAWIDAVQAASPLHPGQIEVRLILARPVLDLGDGGLVSADGRLLGPGPVALDPVPLSFWDAGARDVSAIAEAAAAAAQLLPFRPQLEREELGVERVGVEAGGLVVFVTREGVLLEWGRSARATAFSEVDLPPAARVAGLLEVAARRPGLLGVARVVLWKERPDVLLRP